MTQRAGIETLYDGVQFRSRLEARWAAFFTLIGWQWVYEPFDGDYYIPDFLISGDRPMLVEVRPAVTQADYERQIPTIKVPDWRGDILIVGASPISPCFERIGVPTAGLLGEWMAGPVSSSEEGDNREFGFAIWNTCGFCGLLGVIHEYQSFAGRPCGHHDGDGYISPPDEELIRQSWAKACNLTRWTAA